METVERIGVLIAKVDNREDGTYSLTEPATPEKEAATICRLAEQLGRPLSRRVVAAIDLIEQEAARIAPSLIREVGYDLTLAMRYLNTKLPKGYHVQKVEEGYVLINQTKRDAFYSEIEEAV